MLRVTAAQLAPPIVYVVPIDGIIDLGLAPFLARTLREAESAGAAAVLLDINTFGGRVDAAVAMRDTLLNSPVRTIAFINQRAISAGALIALACHTIVMAPGGTIGAAAPVLGGAGPTQPADEKSVSYVRKEFRATAETRNRPPEFAEAMVDVDVAIEGVVESGKLLTLTTTEALAHKVVELSGSSVTGALDAGGLPGAQLRYAAQTWAETFVRFLTNPVVSSLLMSIGLLALFVEIRTPGFAIPGFIGLASLGLLFWGHWIVQLAGWEELMLVGAGLILCCGSCRRCRSAAVSSSMPACRHPAAMSRRPRATTTGWAGAAWPSRVRAWSAPSARPGSSATAARRRRGTTCGRKGVRSNGRPGRGGWWRRSPLAERVRAGHGTANRRVTLIPDP